MNQHFREAVKEVLVDCLMDTMFGDGQEEEYIRQGIEFKGLDNMTDQELIEELKEMIGADSPDFKPDMEDKVHLLYQEITRKRG